jgi:hypothetical protein
MMEEIVPLSHDATSIVMMNLQEWHDPVNKLNDAAFQFDSTLKSLDFIVEKIDEEKLVHDIDDISVIFEDLVKECENKILNVIESEKPPETSDENVWISHLDEDAMNVDEISNVFDQILAEQEEVGDEIMTETTDEDDEDDEDDDDDTDYDENKVMEPTIASPTKMVFTAPVWTSGPPIDPRSCIRTPIFQNLDPRIPRISIPRIDLATAPMKPLSIIQPSMINSVKKKKVIEEKHEASTCWICKSSKSPQRKRALHRYLAKRSRRNWKRGPRYVGRSSVALNRTRFGGRFIQTAQWI